MNTCAPSIEEYRMAIREGNREIILAAVKNNLDIYESNTETILSPETNALHAAIKNNDYAAVTAAVAAGANLKSYSLPEKYDTCKPVIFCATTYSNYNIRMVELLVNLGADRYAKTLASRNIMHELASADPRKQDMMLLLYIHYLHRLSIFEGKSESDRMDIHDPVPGLSIHATVPEVFGVTGDSTSFCLFRWNLKGSSGPPKRDMDQLYAHLNIAPRNLN